MISRPLYRAERTRFKEMVQAKVKSDGVSYRTMMDVCAKVRQQPSGGEDEGNLWPPI